MPQKTKRCPKCGRTHAISVAVCDCGNPLPNRASIAQGPTLRDVLREFLTPWYLINFVCAILAILGAGGLIALLAGRFINMLDLAGTDAPPPFAFSNVLALVVGVIASSSLAAVLAYLLRQALARRAIIWSRMAYYAGFGALWWMAVGMMAIGLFPVLEWLTFNQASGSALWPWLPLGLCLVIITIPTTLIFANEKGN